MARKFTTPILLPGPPDADLQASTKGYVDVGLAAKSQVTVSGAPQQVLDIDPTPITAASIGAQPADADLTTIAALDATQSGVLASDGSGWLRKGYSALKTALALVKGDVGLGNVDNTSDANKPVSTAQATAIAGRAPLLTEVAAKTADYTANAGELVPIDTTAGTPVVITLPPVGAGGTLPVQVGVRWEAGTANTSARLASTGGDFIGSGSGTLTFLAIQGETLILQSAPGQGRWRFVANHRAIGQTDLRYSPMLTDVPTKTANYTAAAGELVPVDTSGGSPIAVTLPAVGAAGTIPVQVGVRAEAGGILPDVVAAGSNTIGTGAGVSSTFVPFGGGTVVLQSVPGTGKWRFDRMQYARAALDARYVGQSLRGPIGGVVTLTYAATITTDATLATHFRCNLAGNPTLAKPTGAVDGQSILWMFAAGAAARTVTLAASGFEKLSTIDTVLSVPANKIAFLTAKYDGSRDVVTVLGWDVTA